MNVGQDIPFRPSETQQTLLSWFQRNAPSLGELYEGSLRLLYENQVPGYTRYISHSVREIRNRLPEIFAGPRGGRRLNYTDRVGSIAQMWYTHGITTEEGVSVSGPDTALPTDEELSYVSIPTEIYNAFDKLISDHTAVYETRREGAERLFQAASQERVADTGSLNPAIQNWLEITKWFMKNAHDGGKTDSTIEINELKTKFERFETMLNGLIGQFFSTTDRLDEILYEANS